MTTKTSKIDVLLDSQSEPSSTFIKTIDFISLSSAWPPLSRVNDKIQNKEKLRMKRTMGKTGNHWILHSEVAISWHLLGFVEWAGADVQLYPDIIFILHGMMYT